MNRKNVLSALAMVGMGVSAHVQADNHSGFYAGMGAGVITNEADGFEGRGVAPKFFAGYTFNEYFAAQAEYIWTGELEDTVEGLDVKVESDGLVVAALGKLPLGDVFSMYAKLGYTFYDEKVSATRGSVSFSEKNSGDDLLYGVGAQIQLGRRFELRAEYEVVDVTDADFNFLSASAVFRF